MASIYPAVQNIVLACRALLSAERDPRSTWNQAERVDVDELWAELRGRARRRTDLRADADRISARDKFGPVSDPAWAPGEHHFISGMAYGKSKAGCFRCSANVQ